MHTACDFFVGQRGSRDDTAGSLATLVGTVAAPHVSSSRVVVVHAHETRKSLAFSTASAQRDAARGPRQPLRPAQRASTAGAGPRGGRGAISQRLSPNRQSSRFFALSWRAGTPPSRPGRKAHICCLSGGTDGVSPEGP